MEEALPTRSARNARTEPAQSLGEAADMEQRQIQATEENRSLVLETARRVALDILVSRTGVDALHHIAEAARDLAQARYAAVGVAHPDGHGLMEFVTVGLTPEEEA